jgi:hypothetical protein
VTYVAPARYPLTAVHITRDNTRTLCGRPMDPDGLWQPVDGPDPPCKACALVAARQETRT